MCQYILKIQILQASFPPSEHHKRAIRHYYNRGLLPFTTYFLFIYDNFSNTGIYVIGASTVTLRPPSKISPWDVSLHCPFGRYTSRLN